MVIEYPEPVELEAWQHELDTVLRSQTFAHAPTLAHLLSYLCEKRLAGESGRIKEYSIGVDVFHRGVEFDQETDSIVRVEVNRLRKRLSDYYAGEGSAHRLHIAIPVGQYVPDFQTMVAAEPAKDRESLPAKPMRLPAHWALWLASFLLAALLIASGAWWIARHPEHQTPAQAATPLPAASESLIGLPGGQEIRILAGSSRGYVDHAGKLWNADAWFTDGVSVKREARHIARTQDPSFYRSSREGQFRYDIPLKPGVYELRLHFAENVYGPENNGEGGEGSRLMSVRVNGRALLTHFDVLADAGGGAVADVKVFPDQTPAPDGSLHLEFIGENGSSATLSAIEIVPGLRGRMRPVRILARQTPYYSNDSQWWSPDSYFDGGQLAAYSDPVTGTDDPELYETERWGNFSYAIPASPGRYTLLLHFAVRHRAWNQPAAASDQGSVEHVFNVFCNGRAILDNFDLMSEGRPADVVIRRIAAVEPNAQGKVLLSFVPVKGYASVTGIELLPQ